MFFLWRWTHSPLWAQTGQLGRYFLFLFLFLYFHESFASDSGLCNCEQRSRKWSKLQLLTGTGLTLGWNTGVVAPPLRTCQFCSLEGKNEVGGTAGRLKANQRLLSTQTSRPCKLFWESRTKQRQKPPQINYLFASCLLTNRQGGYFQVSVFF